MHDIEPELHFLILLLVTAKNNYKLPLNVSFLISLMNEKEAFGKRLTRLLSNAGRYCQPHFGRA
jgi:hypothetical protein